MERLPEHKTAYKILDEIRGAGYLWHRISLKGFRNVIKCGEIHSNLDNRYEPTYGQSKISLARKLKSFSLFDFDSEPIENIIRQESDWVSFFMDQKPLTIVMAIKKADVGHRNLIYPSSIPSENILSLNDDGVEFYPTVILPVEVFSPSSIKTEYIRELLLVKYGGDFTYERIPYDNNSLDFVEKLAEEWATQIKVEEEEDRKNPFSLENLLASNDGTKRY